MQDFFFVTSERANNRRNVREQEDEQEDVFYFRSVKMFRVFRKLEYFHYLTVLNIIFGVSPSFKLFQATK